MDTRGLILDPACPIEWAHPLNRGLVADWTVAPNPGWSRGLTLRDLVGLSNRKGHDGTLINGPPWVGGMNGFGGLHFTAETQYVSLPDITLGNGADNGWTLWADVTPDSGTDLGLIVGDNDTTPAIYVWNNGFFAFYDGQVVNNTTAIAAGTRYVVVCVKNASGKWIYVDGREEGSGSGMAAAHTFNMRLGSDQNGGGAQGYHGKIHASGCFDRALSAGEAALFTQQVRRGNPDRYRWLRPWSLGVTVAGGGGDVTVALTGQGATASAGTLSPANSVALSGSESVSAAGTLTPAPSVALSGQSLTPAAGTLAPELSVALSGVALSVVAGNLTVGDVTVALTGQSLAASAGTLTPALSLALSGQALTPAAGTLAPTLSAALSGLALSVVAGTLTASGGAASAGHRIAASVIMRPRIAAAVVMRPRQAGKVV